MLLNSIKQKQIKANEKINDNKLIIIGVQVKNNIE